MDRAAEQTCSLFVLNLCYYDVKFEARITIRHPPKKESIMAKGNNSQKNDKKNKKPKQDKKGKEVKK